MRENQGYLSQIEETCRTLKKEEAIIYLDRELAIFYTPIFYGHNFKDIWEGIEYLQHLKEEYLQLEKRP